ncbi:UNVERIFIED_CONTAM: hypothetical protein GTU68_065911 [Idotea baltica]|nr:hypothetical protein [Idotea baltica]
MNVEKIMKMLPHRYPMLMIDRINSIDEEKIVAIKNVTINEDFFNGSVARSSNNAQAVANSRVIMGSGSGNLMNSLIARWPITEN